MKKIVLLLCLVVSLVSCGYRHHNVRLSNNSVVVAYDEQDRPFKSGDTICISKTTLSYDEAWSITKDGEMMDTTMLHTYTDSKDKEHNWLSYYKLGVIE